MFGLRGKKTKSKKFKVNFFSFVIRGVLVMEEEKGVFLKTNPFSFFFTRLKKSGGK